MSTVVVTSDMTIILPVIDGTIYQPSNGITISLASGFWAPGVTVFDTSHGGNVIVANGSLSWVDPRWWGLTTTGGTEQSTEVQSANVAAFNAANSALTSGFVLMPAGSIVFNAPLICCDSNQKGIRGAGDNLTIMYWSTQGPKLIAGSQTSSFANEIFVERLTCSRLSAPNASRSAYEAAGFLDISTTSATTTAPPTSSQLNSLAIGIILVGAANPNIEYVRVNDDMIGFYMTHTTGMRGRELLASHSYAGAKSDLRVGFYLDGRVTAVAGTSANGSWGVDHPFVNKGQFVGICYGMILDGRPSSNVPVGDIRDIWPTNYETASCDYGLVATSSGVTAANDAMDTDIKFDSPKIDTVSAIGVYLSGLGNQASIRLTNVHLNGTTGCSQLFVAYNCFNGIYLDGEFDGGSAYQTAVGAAFINCRKPVIGPSSMINLAYGVVAQSASGGQSVVGLAMGTVTHSNYSGRNGVTRVYIEANVTDFDIGLQILDGQATTGIEIDPGATGSYRNPKVIGAYTNPVIEYNQAGSKALAFG